MSSGGVALTVILMLAFMAVMFLLGTGLAMIVIGAIGHIFNIETFKLLSFWEVAILAFILGTMGATASRD